MSSTSSSLDLDDSTASALEWIKTHSRQVGFGALGVAVLAGVLWVVRAQNERNEVNASQALVAAQRSVGSGNLAVAATELQKVADRYGSTRAGADAKLLLGQVLLQQGKHADALKLLDGMGASGPSAASVHALRAAALEQSGQPAEAAAAYLRAAEATILEAEGESFRSDAARAYVTAGKPEEALRIWQAIASNPSSVLYNEARLRVGELTAKSQP